MPLLRRGLRRPALIRSVAVTSLAVHHLAFRTRDLPTLQHFYTELFGFIVVREQPGHSVWLRAGESVLMLEIAAPDEPLIMPGSMEFVAFCVDDDGRNAVREKLAAWGSAPEAETAYTTYLRDPDGRRVGVSTYDFARAPW